MIHHQRSTDVVSYAWSAAVVCVPCVRRRLTDMLRASERLDKAESDELETAGTDELRALYARVALGTEMKADDLDTADMPQPIFASDVDAETDVCDSCLVVIKEMI